MAWPSAAAENLLNVACLGAKCLEDVESLLSFDGIIKQIHLLNSAMERS